MAGECQPGSNPCDEGEECDEANDRCLPRTAPCSISIEPGSADVRSRETVAFTVIPNGDCSTPDYAWSVESTIGSKVDQNGVYTAGLSLNIAYAAVEVVKVVDHGNSEIEAEATVSVSLCSAIHLYGENSAEVAVLRHFRDSILSATPEGQEIIKLYYECSSLIVKAMEEDEEFKEDVKEMIDGILLMISEETE